MTNNKSSTGTIRFQYLDSLRGFAALWVLIVHVAMMPQPNFLLPEWFSIYVRNGTMGVELFFVVSALSLCLSMKSHDAEKMPLLGFAIRRFFRIAPLFYILLVVTYFFNPAGFDFNWKTIFSNLFFIFNLIPGHSYQTSLVLAGWTIGVEVIFYLLFPLFIKKIDNTYKAICLAISSIIFAQVFLSIAPLIFIDWQSYNMYSIISKFPIFIFGIIAFFILKDIEPIKNKKSIGGLLISISILLFFSLNSKNTPFFNSYYWTGVMFLFLVIGLNFLPLRIFVNKITAWLGKISYSIYLVHSPIVALLFPAYKNIQTYGFGNVLTFLLCSMLTIFLVIPVAALIFHIIENPANIYGRRISKKLAGAKIM